MLLTHLKMMQKGAHTQNFQDFQDSILYQNVRYCPKIHDNIEKILDLFIFKKIIAKKCNNKKIMSNQFFLSYKFVIEKDVLSGINLSQKFFLSDKTFDQKIFCQIKLLVRNFSCLSCFRSFLIGKQFCQEKFVGLKQILVYIFLGGKKSLVKIFVC